LQGAEIAQQKKHRRRRRETIEEQRARAGAIGARLASTYPALQVPLKHRNTFELLIAVILSAQCTDEAVNRVTPELFRHYSTPEQLA
jgi:endonuclease III